MSSEGYINNRASVGLTAVGHVVDMLSTRIFLLQTSLVAVSAKVYVKFIDHQLLQP
jgi:hypothetical protein